MGEIGRWLSMPLAALRILSGAKSFALPVLGDEGLNRRGLHVWRTCAAHRLADRRRRRLEHLVAPDDRDHFAQDGYVEKADFLPAGTFADLVQQVTALSAPAREMREGAAVTRRIAITSEVLRAAPALKALIDSPVFKGLTRYVSSFDEEPLVQIQTIFGRAGDDPQTSLHMDTFHPTMKAWFFLHDVADDEGPFTYVSGSHKLSARRLAWQKRQSILASRIGGAGGSFRLKPDELGRLHWPAPRRFAVRGNTLVVGDTCGFHARAYSPKATVRIEIYASSRPNPFKPTTGLGLDRVPFLGSRRSEAFWWLQDRLAPLGLMRPTWRDVGRVSPAAPSSIT